MLLLGQVGSLELIMGGDDEHACSDRWLYHSRGYSHANNFVLLLYKLVIMA